MSAPLFVLIGLAFLNGQPVKIEAGDVYDKYSDCDKDAKSSYEQAKHTMPKEIQAVYLCVDVSQTKPSVSGFGQAAD